MIPNLADKRFVRKNEKKHIRVIILLFVVSKSSAKRFKIIKLDNRKAQELILINFMRSENL